MSMERKRKLAKTISGHQAITSWGSPLLRAARIPGTKISLRTRRAALPLFLHVAARLNKEVQALSPKDTWSFNYRKPRMGSGTSDHAGYAIDCWSSTIGAHTWPSRMPKTKARKMAKILESYKTKDGRHVFGWGIAKVAPGGDIYTGPTYNNPKYNDPMHVFIAPGISMRDVMNVRKAMKIDRNGRSK